MIDGAAMMVDEFISRLQHHEIFYLKGTDRKVYLKRSYDESYILSNTDQGFLVVAENMTVSKMDDRLLLFYGGEDEHIIFDLMRDKWECDE